MQTHQLNITPVIFQPVGQFQPNLEQRRWQHRGNTELVKTFDHQIQMKVDEI